MNTPIFEKMLAEGFWAGRAAAPLERQMAMLQRMFDKLTSVGAFG